MTDDYEIGYGRPPKHSRFKPGQSGNPRGRLKGARNLKTELEEELHEHIPIKEGGHQKRVSKQRAMIKALMAKAVQGDARAANIIIKMIDRLFGDQAGEHEIEELSEQDQKILKAYEARILGSAKRKEKKNEIDKI